MIPESYRPKIVRDSSGSAFNCFFDDIYASRDGAYEQAKFVFLRGNDLPARWEGKKQFVILENGFGLGTNFLATLKLWREDENHCQRLHYVAIEGFPASSEQLIEFADPNLKPLARELSSKWSLTVPGVWQNGFNEGFVTLTVYFMDVLRASKLLSLGFDCLFLDGFSPSKNPKMWEPRVLKNLCKHARKDSTVSTWCVAGSVRKALEESGFLVQRVQGFGHKRQMLQGCFRPKFVHRRQHVEIETNVIEPKKVLVIGAGLAGAAVSKVFSNRGVNVRVIDAGRIPASGASAIRWGIAHTHYTTDDNFLFRLSRVGFRLLKESLIEEGFGELPKGLMQVAKDDQQYKRWAENFANSLPFEMPEDGFIQLINEEEGRKRMGLLPTRGGLWNDWAGTVAISRWVRHRIEKYVNELTLNTKVDQIKKINNRWVAFDQNRRELCGSDVVVLCAAYGSGSLCPYPLGLTRNFGRLSIVYDNTLENLNQAVLGPGYAINSDDGWAAIGATYEQEDEHLSVQEAHTRNLSHFKNMISWVEEVGVNGFYEGYRVVSADRLPLIGALKTGKNAEDLEGLYVACAMGSRGLIFSELAARIICAQVYGEPTCLESDLIKAVSPCRFMDRVG